LLHIDIKVPSEHTLEGKRFPGEYQMFHLHPYRNRSPAISVFFDYDDDTPTNLHFQMLLDHFWMIFNKDLTMCRNKNVDNDPGRNLRGDRNTDEEEQEDLHQAMADKRNLKKQVENGLTWLLGKFQGINKSIEGVQKDAYEVSTANRVLQGPKQVGISSSTPGSWDPYQWGSIINTFHFYGYKGSTTEPPCKSF
jgi:hypothetical protein